MAKILSDSVKGKLEDSKRFYLPGVKVTDNCPKCGKQWTFDGDTDYISYPIVGDWLDLGAYCDGCDNNWEVKVQLQIKINF